MRITKAIILLACTVEADAQLVAQPMSKVVLPNLVPAAPYNPGFRTGFRTPQQQFPNVNSRSTFVTKAEKSAAKWISDWKAKAGEASGEIASEVETPTLGSGLNIYGQTLQKCGYNVFGETANFPGGDLSEQECPYTKDLPRLCVAQITRRYEPQKNSPVWIKKPGADNWKEGEYKGKCVSIWDLAPDSGFFGQAGLAWAANEGVFNTYGIVPTDYLPKCESLPAEVLQSQYSMETYRSCYLAATTYKYVDGGKSQTVSSNKNPFFIEGPGREAPLLMSGKCEAFRSAIKDICTACAAQTSDASAKGTLESLCQALAAQGAEFDLIAENSPDDLKITAAFMISTFVGSAVILAMLRFRRGAQTADGAMVAGKEPLMAA